MRAVDCPAGKPAPLLLSTSLGKRLTVFPVDEAANQAILAIEQDFPATAVSIRMEIGQGRSSDDEEDGSYPAGNTPWSRDQQLTIVRDLVWALIINPARAGIEMRRQLTEYGLTRARLVLPTGGTADADLDLDPDQAGRVEAFERDFDAFIEALQKPGPEPSSDPGVGGPQT